MNHMRTPLPTVQTKGKAKGGSKPRESSNDNAARQAKRARINAERRRKDEAEAAEAAEARAEVAARRREAARREQMSAEEEQAGNLVEEIEEEIEGDVAEMAYDDEPDEIEIEIDDDDDATIDLDS